MDDRAQISVELILFLAIVLAIVLVFATFIADANEKNIIETSVKLGADNATSTMALLDRSMQPLRVTSIDVTGSDPIVMTLHFSRPIDYDTQKYVAEGVVTSLISQGYDAESNYTDTNKLKGNVTLQKARHNYLIETA
ncbi:class III signal peptide-containing protein [Methanobacterium aggregans]|uniref:class III signal peptide-containing protein n=1 Tax=Methanobacterium aggregans TaxID=1615586 RepID=UPI00320E0A37